MTGRTNWKANSNLGTRRKQVTHIHIQNRKRKHDRKHMEARKHRKHRSHPMGAYIMEELPNQVSRVWM